MSVPDYIRLETRGDGIAVLTLDNPPLNLNTLTTLDKLKAACARIKADVSVRVLVITGSGDRAFCAGSDIKEFAEVREDVVSRKLTRENEAFTAIEQLPVPVIAALNGVTLGGGAEIALACDIRIIDESTRIGFPEIKLGVFPGSGGVFRLPKIVGHANALELLYGGELVSAKDAHRMGLVNRIAPANRALETAIEYASMLANRPALALALIKSGVRESARQSTEESTQRTLVDSDRVFRGPDIDEGMEAFFMKRTPSFTAPRPNPIEMEENL
ncbi:hypothetical protein N182_30140 [Sinorhizobium sp. GL2]|nr:hypothetical protein N182_30140 [Sinorhizobium sp. GL2]